MKCQNMNKNKTIHKYIYDMQKIQKEEYVDGNIVWVLLCTDIQRQTLFVDIFAGNSVFRGEHIDTLSLEETYETLFNYIMILLNEKYSFCIFEYKSFRHNLMRNDGFIKNN